MQSTQKCTKCKKRKPITSFHKDAQKKTGYSSHCKECKKKWCQENSEYLVKKSIEWQKLNPDRAKEHALKWTKNNPDKVKTYRKKYSKKAIARRASDPAILSKRREQNNRAAKKYQKIHPEMSTVRHCRRSALKRNAVGNFTKTEWQDLCDSYGHVCLCCGQKKKLTADHIVPLSRGGTNSIDNIQPLCLPCNASKGTKTIDYRPNTV